MDLPVHRTEELKQSKRFRELETLVLERIRAQAKGGACESPHNPLPLAP